ncbi:MAG: glycoside hydrolase family 127 protein [Prevotella sp.]|nr:glycoside hydrolase family 127 protein [Prevotella sp.]
MKKSLTAILLTICVVMQAQYPIVPVPFTSVKLNDGFWTPRLNASRDVTIPLAFSKCEETGRYDNFVNAAKHLANPSLEFPDTAWTFSFDDTDPYKTIEGASYLLQTYPNATYKGRRLDQYVDSVIAIIASGQEPDGYLFTARTKSPSKPHEWAGPKRWVLVEKLSHEFYNLGHLLEAACAHYQATGKRNFLDVAIKYADCVCREIGPGDNQLKLVPGHQIAEMGLCKLYLVTGNKKYLDQAKFFLDMRGKTSRKDAYSQAHKPVIEQEEAVGHAVRAEYMYSGMADVAALTGDSAYIKAIDKIWDNIVQKKYYITGGVGARHAGESFGNNYELPNASAYCETCAQIGNVYTNYRLFLLHGSSKYYDVIERTLYNALISGISIEGDGFFYPNPLSCREEAKYARQPWFGCACCPSNICRFIPSLPGYIYASKQDKLYVNLFMGNTMETNVNGKAVTLKQETNYPSDGDVKLTIVKGGGNFDLNIRIPGWVRGEVVPSDLYSFVDGKHLDYCIKVNGKEVINSNVKDNALTDGYAVLNRKWKKGDVIEIHFDMEPRLVKANDKVVDDRGRLAVERGPLVYCAEWPDNDADVSTYLLNQNPQLNMGKDITITAGHKVLSITTNAQALSIGSDGKLKTADKTLTLIPYYAWDHRGQKGGMDVWLPAAVGAASATHIAAEEQADNGFFGK